MFEYEHTLERYLRTFPPEDSPCYGCPFFDHCKEHQTACVRFWKHVERDLYIDMSKHDIEKPLKSVYDAVFCGQDKPPASLVKLAKREARRQDHDNI